MSKTPTPLPILLDLDTLTQEQFDRAMANPGSCRYSGPCIIGAMLPQKMIDEIVHGAYDSCSVLSMGAYFLFDGLEALERAQLVQQSFDALSSDLEGSRDNARARLKDLLPHLDHSGY
jgi:hypothetical protein